MLPPACQDPEAARTLHWHGGPACPHWGLVGEARRLRRGSPSRMDLFNVVASAVVQTHRNAQSGRDLFCESTRAEGLAFVCSMTPQPAEHTTEMVHWNPGAAGAGGATTLEISGLEPVPVKRSNGVSDPQAGDIEAGRLNPVWFDDTVFRMYGHEPKQETGGAERPACTVAEGGRFWYTSGSPGVKDEVAVCVRDAADEYAWWGLLG